MSGGIHAKHVAISSVCVVITTSPTRIVRGHVLIAHAECVVGLVAVTVATCLWVRGAHVGRNGIVTVQFTLWIRLSLKVRRSPGLPGEAKVQCVVKVVLFNEGQQADKVGTTTGVGPVIRTRCRENCGWKLFEHVMVVVHCNSQLVEIVLALCSSSGLAGLLHRR